MNVGYRRRREAESHQAIIGVVALARQATQRVPNVVGSAVERIGKGGRRGDAYLAAARENRRFPFARVKAHLGTVDDRADFREVTLAVEK